MAEFSYDKLVKSLQKDSELTQGKAAVAQGVSIGQIPMMKFCAAQVEAGVYAKAPATAASVKKLRDGESNRWELIAARTGLGVAAVKTKYEEAGGDVTAYVGKGRDFSGVEREIKKPAAKAKPAVKPATGKAAASKPAPSGKASAKKGSAAVKAAAPVRAKTRAERQARAGSPS